MPMIDGEYVLPMSQGNNDPDLINCLLELSKLNDNTKKALRQYFVYGMDINLCCNNYGLRQPNLKRSIDRLNEINHIACKIVRIYLNAKD